ncbi:PAX transactivation activation domain-interacting protein [Aphelenchoides bicaudatus]|nr:PAX transactivation activation domain-interacting protein [Aphelenchoides bicaudatus]
MDQPMSPLEPLDPHRLRDMVVDKQSAGTPHQQAVWSQQTANTMSPASIGSPHSIVNARVSSGSADVSSPFQTRPASQQQLPPHASQSFDFNPRTPMYPPGSVPPQNAQMPANCSPTKPMLAQQQHMINQIGRSPQQQATPQQQGHLPASPFQRSSSAASNSCPSPYNQTGGPQQPYQAVHNPMYPHSGYPPTMNVRLPPSYPHASGTVPMAQQQPGQYSNYQGNWTGQAMNQYMVPPSQPQPQQRMVYGPPGTAYQGGMPPPPSPAQTTMMFQRPARPPTAPGQYPNIAAVKPTQTPQPQTPNSNSGQQVGTPPIPQQQVPLSPYTTGQPPQIQQNQPPTTQNYYFAQQPRLQQLQGQSPIRSPFMPGGVSQVPPGTPTGQPIRYAPPQQVAQPPMRSPPLMSPSTAQLPPQRPNVPPVPHPQLQQQHSMEMSGVNGVNPMLRIGGNPVRLPPPTYYGQVFQFMSQRTYPLNDLFLAGCVFFFDDTVHLPDASEVYARLRYYGGDVETHLTTAAHNQRVTHLVSENLSSKARTTIKYPVRSVTLNWLTDTLAKRKLDVPTRAVHLPSPWLENQLPATDKLIASEGFSDSEILCIRSMCKRVGAQYTSYFTSKHAALISKSESGQRSHQAEEWKVPVLNYGWLVRLYFGNLQVINEIGRDIHRPPGDVLSTVDTTPYTLERVTELCLKVLQPWRMPLIVNDETMNRAIAIRQQIENDPSIFAYKKLKQFLPPPSEEQIEEALKILEKAGKMPAIRLYIDGLPESILTPLIQKSKFLGAQMAESIIECTHYIVPSLKRTLNLCEALARGKAVVEPAWIEHSFRSLQFIDPFEFYVRDHDQERRYRFNVLNTVYRARERAVFEDITFHLSQSVRPSLDALRRLIEAAGGTVETEKPSLKKLAEHIRYDKTYLVVLSETDSTEYSQLYEKRIPIFNEELIFMSILRHRIDTSNTYRLNPALKQLEPPKLTPTNSAKFSRQQKLEQKTF